MKKYISLLILLLIFFSFMQKTEALTNITINNNTLVPSFSKNVKEYNVFVNNKTEIITINVTKEDAEIVTGDGSKSLKKGLNIIEIISYINDKEVDKYTLNIVRGELKSDKKESTLESLTIKNHEIDFKSDTFTYSIDALSNEDRLEITYETLNPLTTVKVTGDVNLTKKENIIKLEVTSEDKKNTNTYIVKVNKKKEKKETSKKEGFFDNKNFDSFELKLIRIGIITGCLIILGIISYFIFKKKD